jgi:hypothetical protein
VGTQAAQDRPPQGSGMSVPYHVVFDLPSGSRADITFYNYQDARYVLHAIMQYDKHVGRPYLHQETLETNHER